ncbi:MAG: hypothetical protein R2706_13075 [Acidimicrobiales bacterium]
MRWPQAPRSSPCSSPTPLQRGRKRSSAEAKRFAGSHLVYANVDDDMLHRLQEALGDEPGNA